VVPIPGTEYYLAFVLHNDSDPDPAQRHTIELVKVFNKSEITDQALY
jgi:hypothetical protein